VELTRRRIESFNVGDLSDFFSRFDPEVVYHTRADEPDAHVCHGLDELKGLFATWFESFESLRIDAQEFIDAGDRVITVGLLRGRGKASGVEVKEPYLFVSTLRDGKVIEMREYATREEALSAVGLEEKS
jgi:ketosteroid isomerase-like protein